MTIADVLRKFLVAASPVVVASAIALVPQSVEAQGQDTGAIIMVAADAQGEPLPGVAVAMAGAQGVRTAFTGVDGVVRFRGLVPGTYTATLTLRGWTTLVHEQLRCSATQTTTVRATMALSPIEETVTIIGESPLIDVRAVDLGATISADLLDLTPTASGLWSGVLDRVPGLVNATIDVGGAQSGTQSPFTSHGSLLGQNQMSINGSLTTDMGVFTGGSGMYYSVGSFEEVVVSTAAHGVEVQAPGVAVNMVSKSGSNQLRGMARFAYSTDSFVGDNIDADLEAAGVTQGNPNTLLSDLNVQVGGPLVRDKLFAFVDYWRFKTERLVDGAPADEKDDTSLRNWTVNTSWQMSPDHRLSARYFSSRKFRGNVGLNALRPPESAWVQDPAQGRILQLDWQGVLSPTAYADVRVSHRRAGIALVGRRPGTANPHPDYPVGQPVTFDLVTGRLTGTPWEFSNQQIVSQVSGNWSQYLAGENVSHDLQFGFSGLRSRNWLPSTTIGGIWQYTLNGAPFFVELDNSPQRDVVSAEPEDSAFYANSGWSFYLQDTITYRRRLTVGVGLRFDHTRSSIPRQRRTGSAWEGLIPEDQFGDLYDPAEFAAQDPVVVLSDLVPRISVIYDLSGSGRTVVKASYGRYSLQQGSSLSRFSNLNLTGWNGYFWNDANADGVFQFGEQGPLVYSIFPGANFAVDPDFRSPIQEEITVGIEHEIDRDLSIGGTFIYHNTLHQMEDINIGVPYGSIADRLGVPDSYTPVDWVDPGPDGVIGTADDGGPLTVFNQDPSTFGDDFFLLANADSWGLDAPVRYRGFELTLRRRYADGWQAMVSWTVGKSTSGLGGSAGGLGGNRAGTVFDNPNADINRYGITGDDRRHIVKVTGNYLLARSGINFGVNFRYESGRPALRFIRTPTGLLNQGSISVAAAGRGEDTNTFGLGSRLGDVVILDLRAEKQFDLPGRWGRASFYVDGFNLTNENAVLNATQVSGPTYGTIRGFVAPRMFRLGVAWIF